MSKTVVLGMSGGVDSSVCAALLKEQGYNVIGLFMKNWEETDENGVCQASKEYADVVSVCEELDIPYYSVEFVEEYKKNVFKSFVEDYKNGLTPNPDILCNREIKFKVFFNKALEMGADYLATGHYCQNILLNEKQHLVKGLDNGKDQTYFLYTIKEEILQKVLFPIGGLQKSEVREIARKYNLETKNKKDSTGICFIGERNFKNFLSNYISFKKGEFRHLDGTVVGNHDGASYYTIGQRKGLGLGGPGEPWYVVDKNVNDNIVYVERGENHPALFSRELWANEITWVNNVPAELPLKCFAKVRYRQQDQECTIESIDENNIIHIIFDEEQRAVTLGQSIVLYQDIDKHRVCLGGGVVTIRGNTILERGLDQK